MRIFVGAVAGAVFLAVLSMMWTSALGERREAGLGGQSHSESVLLQSWAQVAEAGDTAAAGVAVAAEREAKSAGDDTWVPGYPSGRAVRENEVIRVTARGWMQAGSGQWDYWGIDLVTANGDIAFHMSVRCFTAGNSQGYTPRIVLNSKTNGFWGREEVHWFSNNFPLCNSKHEFTLEFVLTSKTWRVVLNKGDWYIHQMDFVHRMDPQEAPVTDVRYHSRPLVNPYARIGVGILTCEHVYESGCSSPYAGRTAAMFSYTIGRTQRPCPGPWGFRHCGAAKLLARVSEVFSLTGNYPCGVPVMSGDWVVVQRPDCSGRLHIESYCADVEPRMNMG